MTRTLPAFPRRALLGAGVGLAAAGRARAAEPFRIGVLADMSGAYADVSGAGSVVAARLAVADFGAQVLGRPIEVVSADHLNKTDVGVAIAREWLGPGKVNLILEIGNSAVALALQTLVREADRVAIPVSAVTSDLTGKACSPNSIHWAQDNWSNGVGLMRAVLASGKRTFFFVTVDYSFGLSLEADAAGAIAKAGGKVLGRVRHPLNTTDFSSYLLQAQTSGAEVVVFASAGHDAVTAIEQAHEFGLTPKQVLAAPSFYLSTAHAIGLAKAQGLLVMQSWYWDTNDETRAWAQRFFRARQRMPNDCHAADYSATLHYLRAVAQTGTNAGRTVIAAMRAAPVVDVFTKDGRIRPDNKMVFTRDLMRVKAPAQSKGEWDLLELIGTVPPDQGFRPLGEGGCPMVKA